MTITDFFQNFFAASFPYVIAVCLLIAASFVFACLWGVKAARFAHNFEDHMPRMNENFSPYGSWSAWLGVIGWNLMGIRSFEIIRESTNLLVVLLVIFGPGFLALIANRILAEVAYRVTPKKPGNKPNSVLNSS